MAQIIQKNIPMGAISEGACVGQHTQHVKAGQHKILHGKPQGEETTSLKKRVFKAKKALETLREKQTEIGLKWEEAKEALASETNPLFKADWAAICSIHKEKFYKLDLEIEEMKLKLSQLGQPRESEPKAYTFLDRLRQECREAEVPLGGQLSEEQMDEVLAIPAKGMLIGHRKARITYPEGADRSVWAGVSVKDVLYDVVCPTEKSQKEQNKRNGRVVHFSKTKAGRAYEGVKGAINISSSRGSGRKKVSPEFVTDDSGFIQEKPVEPTYSPERTRVWPQFKVRVKRVRKQLVIAKPQPVTVSERLAEMLRRGIDIGWVTLPWEVRLGVAREFSTYYVK